MPLTDEQEAAVKQIQREWKKPSPKPVLIEGVTGSGKTQVYIKLIEQTLSQGKEAIVLIPEIALTYQTVRRFYARFGDNPDNDWSQISIVYSVCQSGTDHY